MPHHGKWILPKNRKETKLKQIDYSQQKLDFNNEFPGQINQYPLFFSA